MYKPVALRPASLRASTPAHRMQPSHPVYHPVGAAHRAFGGARSSPIVFAILMQRKIHSL
jgi:hypothetical protein